MKAIDVARGALIGKYLYMSRPNINDGVILRKGNGDQVYIYPSIKLKMMRGKSTY